MKKSLGSQALFLSLSVLVLVGSGCDRRGRAPIKAAVGTPPLAVTGTSPGVAPTPGPSDAPKPSPSNGPDVTNPLTTDAAKEKQAQDDAQMTECNKIESVDVNGKVGPDEFYADQQLTTQFGKCISSYGIVLNCSDASGKDCPTGSPAADRYWKFDSSPDATKKSAAYRTFADLAKQTNDEEAGKIMENRRLLSIIRIGKMAKKYNDDSLKAAKMTAADTINDKSGNKAFTVGGVLLDLQKVTTALTDGAADIKALKTTTDGVTTSDEAKVTGQQ
jgi:hypothetical protein